MTVDVVTGEAAPPPRRAFRPVLAIGGLALALLGLWARGLPAFVAWEVARDHQRCFGRRHLAARVWSSDPSRVRDWLESRGTPTPPLPRGASSADLVGARYCPLEDRVAAHVYYAGEGGAVSVFLLAGPARIGNGWAGTSRGCHVRLLRAAGRYVAVVGESATDVAAAAHSFMVMVAAATPDGVGLRSDPAGARRGDARSVDRCGSSC
ncbi:MAG TPA: hypothetical protein VMT70_00590 [Vicinamibacteria bacterium]|nr:hypothetical protein [Vicinamibacteria bacterium]